MNGNGNGNDEPAAIEAVRALRDRGVDDAEQLLEFGTPAEILAACRKWDQRKGRVGKGLLVKWIRAREFEDPAPPPERSAREIRLSLFDAYAELYPEGSSTETHAAMNARRWPDDLERNPCAGRMIVVATIFPILTVECDACGFTAGYSIRALNVLGSPLKPVPDTPADQPF